MLTRHAADLDVEIDPEIAAGEIPDGAPSAVVPSRLCPSAGPTGRFLSAARSDDARVGITEDPVTVGCGRNPGKRYVSRAGAGVAELHASIMPDSSTALPCSRPLPERLPAPSAASFHPHDSTKSLIFFVAVVTLDSRTHGNPGLH